MSDRFDALAMDSARMKRLDGQGKASEGARMNPSDGQGKASEGSVATELRSLGLGRSEAPAAVAAGNDETKSEASTPRSVRSASSMGSRKSGMTESEIKEMRGMAAERGRVALREALSLLQVRWAATRLPEEHIERLRRRLRKTMTIDGSLRAARATQKKLAADATEEQREVLELALLWARCRVRAMLALAVRGTSAELAQALVPAERLGLSVDLEKNLLEELKAQEEATLETALSRENSEPGDASATSEGEANAEGASSSQVPDRPQQQSLSPKRGWFHFWPFRSRSNRDGRIKQKWEGDEQLLDTVKDHVRRGNRPVPAQLAAELGLQKATPSSSSLTAASPLSRMNNMI